jgi:hypothetical protein
MDEEDLGQTIAGVNLITKKSYDTFGDSEKTQQKKEFGASILGEAFDEMFVQNKDSIGHKILYNLQKDLESAPAQTPKQQFLHPNPPPKAKETAKDSYLKNQDKFGPVPTPNASNTPVSKTEDQNTYMNLSKIKLFKDNFTGMGYNASQNSEQFLNYEDELEEKFNHIFKEYLNTKDSTTIDTEQAKKPSRVYMDMFGDNDQKTEEFYSRYEIDQEDEASKDKNSNKDSGPSPSGYTTNILGHFQKSKLAYKIENPYGDTVKLPKDYFPKCQFLKAMEVSNHFADFNKKNSAERGKLLGEPSQKNSHQGFQDHLYSRENALEYFDKSKPLASGLSAATIEMLKNAKQFVPSSEEFLFNEIKPEFCNNDILTKEEKKREPAMNMSKSLVCIIF